jgi:hypothetical protein
MGPISKKKFSGSGTGAQLTCGLGEIMKIFLGLVPGLSIWPNSLEESWAKFLKFIKNSAKRIISLYPKLLRAGKNFSVSG